MVRKIRDEAPYQKMKFKNHTLALIWASIIHHHVTCYGFVLKCQIEFSSSFIMFYTPPLLWFFVSRYVTDYKVLHIWDVQRTFGGGGANVCKWYCYFLLCPGPYGAANPMHRETCNIAVSRIRFLDVKLESICEKTDWDNIDFVVGTKILWKIMATLRVLHANTCYMVFIHSQRALDVIITSLLLETRRDVVLT